MLNTAINTTYSGFDGRVRTLAIQSDGNIFAGGTFSTYNNPGAGSGMGNNYDYILQLDPTGLPLASPITDGVVRKFALDSSDNVHAIGIFSNMNFNAVNGLTKMSSAGVVNPGFLTAQGTAFAAQMDPNAIVVQTDGKVIVGGNLNDFDSHFIGNIVRVSSSGIFDSAFGTNTGTGFDGRILSLALQNDGKILAGGRFLSFNGSVSRSLARLNTSESIDSEFAAKVGTAITPSSDITAIAVQGDGKILIGGDFTTYNGTTVNRIKRITISGEPD